MSALLNFSLFELDVIEPFIIIAITFSSLTLLLPNVDETRRTFHFFQLIIFFQFLSHPHTQAYAMAKSENRKIHAKRSHVSLAIIHIAIAIGNVLMARLFSMIVQMDWCLRAKTVE